jgi:hypothetical protein
MVKGRHGLIPWRQGPDLLAVRAWREQQTELEPRTLEDYYKVHGLCFDCLGQGAKMIGWSDPATSEDLEAVRALNLEQLPLYDVCPTCQGTGKLPLWREL